MSKQQTKQSRKTVRRKQRQQIAWRSFRTRLKGKLPGTFFDNYKDAHFYALTELQKHAVMRYYKETAT